MIINLFGVDDLRLDRMYCDNLESLYITYLLNDDMDINLLHCKCVLSFCSYYL